MLNLRLLIFSPFFPPHVGGLEGYVSDLNDEMMRSRAVDAITVFAPRLPLEGSVREEREGGYVVVRYPAIELIPNFPVPSVWRHEFWKALRSTEPSSQDVFVSHTRFFLSSAFALICARVLSRPLLHVEHGSDFVHLSTRATQMAARLYDQAIGRLLLRHADGIVAISYAAAGFVKRLAGRDAQVIYRGMEVERLDAAIADEQVLRFAAGRPVVSFVGRLIDGKGVSDLIHAFAEIPGGLAVLCVVGDGPRRADLEELARQLEVAERVIFRGYLLEVQAWGAVRASDVVVNPSYTEGLPTSVLEAALMGKAVVATDVGGTSEIVSDRRGGLLFPARDRHALRTLLEDLLTDPALRSRLGSCARAEAEGRFDWHASANRFVEVAEALARSRDGGAAHASGAAGVASSGSEDRASTSWNTDS